MKEGEAVEEEDSRRGRAFKWERESQSQKITIMDGVRLGIGMFIVLPALLIVLGIIAALIFA